MFLFGQTKLLSYLCTRKQNIKVYNHESNEQIQPV